MNRPMAFFEGNNAGEERAQFCWCPPGRFEMGYDAQEVTLTHGFWMGKYPVTQGIYQFIMGENPSAFMGPLLPVESVNRAQVTGFCRALTKLEHGAGRLPGDWEYGLPTEAQWEYACRAGTNTVFPWGDDPSLADEFSWHIGNAGFMTHPVGEKKPNRWGLYDMLGNTLEWCRDSWAERYRGGVDPEMTERIASEGPRNAGSPFWVSRGGGWIIPPSVTARDRIRLGGGDQGYLLGFRVAIIRRKT